MAWSCNAASSSLVDVDIPELSESPWPGIYIFCTSMGLGRQIVKELENITRIPVSRLFLEDWFFAILHSRGQ